MNDVAFAALVRATITFDRSASGLTFLVVKSVLLSLVILSIDRFWSSPICAASSRAARSSWPDQRIISAAAGIVARSRPSASRSPCQCSSPSPFYCFWAFVGGSFATPSSFIDDFVSPIELVGFLQHTMLTSLQ